MESKDNSSISMKKMFAGAISIVFFILVTCSQKELSESFRANLKNKTYVHDILVRQDTLSIVTDEPIWNYPFGFFKRTHLFIDAFPVFHQISVNTYRPFNDSTKPLDTIYRFIHSQSYVKAFNIDSTQEEDRINHMEIISANIFDKEIVFKNGVCVGMPTNDFMALFFTKAIKCNRIKVVELKTAVSKYWYYFSFDNNKIKTIKLNSDFKLPQRQ